MESFSVKAEIRAEQKSSKLQSTLHIASVQEFPVLKTSHCCSLFSCRITSLVSAPPFVFYRQLCRGQSCMVPPTAFCLHRFMMCGDVTLILQCNISNCKGIRSTQRWIYVISVFCTELSLCLASHAPYFTNYLGCNMP